MAKPTRKWLILAFIQNKALLWLNLVGREYQLQRKNPILEKGAIQQTRGMEGNGEVWLVFDQNYQ